MVDIFGCFAIGCSHLVLYLSAPALADEAAHGESNGSDPGTNDGKTDCSANGTADGTADCSANGTADDSASNSASDGGADVHSNL